MLKEIFIVLLFVEVFFSGITRASFSGASSSRPSSSRPSSSENEFPKHFKGNDDKQYVIKMIPEDKYRFVVNWMSLYYFREDPMMLAFQMIRDPNSVYHVEQIWYQIIRKNMSVGCYINGTNVLIGISLLYIENSNEPTFPTPQGAPLKIKLFKEFVYQIIPDDYRTPPTFLDGLIFVLKEYRERGIETELLKIREYVCKENNLSATQSFFTQIYKHSACREAGFSQIYFKSYIELFASDERFQHIPPGEDYMGGVGEWAKNYS